MNFWAVRHPPTVSTGICVGQSTVPLLVSQEEACKQVQSDMPFKPVCLHSSDLSRCADLAEKLAQCWGVPLHIDRRLRELSMGVWEGQRYQDLDSDVAWHTWCRNWKTVTPPQGESLSVFFQRIQNWRNQVNTSENEVLIAHAGVVRCLHVLNGWTWDEAMSLSVPHLQWMKIPIEGSVKSDRKLS